VGYIEEVVTSEEKIVALHSLSGWALWLTPSLFVCAGIVLDILFVSGVFSPLLRGDVGMVLVSEWVISYGGLFLVGWGVWEFLHSFIRWLTVHMGLTDHRVIYKEGLIRRETDEMRLSKVETVDINQSVMGRILGYGTLEMTGTGGSRVVFRDIDEPMRNKRFIDEAVMQAKKHDYR